MIPAHIQYIIRNHSTELLARLKSEKMDIVISQAMDTLLACDHTPGKKLVDWLVRTYCLGGFRWEDVEAGAQSKLAEVLGMYQNYFNQIPRDQRNIYLYKSYGELYTLVQPYLPTLIQSAEETLGSREIKRRERARALEESEVLYRSEVMIVAVPLTQNAAVWWGRVTKWCTAAVKNNYFNNYNKDAPLITITLINSKNTEKFQLWTDGDDIQFMDAMDYDVNINTVEDYWVYFAPILKNLLESNSKALKYIPSKFRTPEMVGLAIEQNPLAFNFINHEDQNIELCKLAIKKNGLLLYSIAMEYKTYEVCMEAVKQNGVALRFVPEEMKTLDLCIEAVKSRSDSLENVPDQFKTSEFCLFAIDQGMQAFYYLPKKMKTAELCKRAVEFNGTMLDYVPEPMKTEEICRLAIKQNGLSLRSLPIEFETFEFYRLSVEQCGEALAYVPVEMRSYELCKRAIEQSWLALEYLRDEFFTDEIMSIAIKQNGNALRCLFPEQRSSELSEKAVRKNAEAIRHVSEEFKTVKLCKLALEQNPALMAYVPEGIRDGLSNIYSVKINTKWNINELESLKNCLEQELIGNIDHTPSSGKR